MKTASRSSSVLLEQRLQRLTGEEGRGCVGDLQSLARTVRDDATFDGLLQRTRSLGDEKRLVAAMLLQRRTEMCACEIQAALGLSHATVNHHMNILLDAGIVKAQKRGKWVYYRLTPEGSRILAAGG